MDQSGSGLQANMLPAGKSAALPQSDHGSLGLLFGFTSSLLLQDALLGAMRVQIGDARSIDSAEFGRLVASHGQRQAANPTLVEWAQSEVALALLVPFPNEVLEQESYTVLRDARYVVGSSPTRGDNSIIFPGVVMYTSPCFYDCSGATERPQV